MVSQTEFLSESFNWYLTAGRRSEARLPSAANTPVWLHILQKLNFTEGTWLITHRATRKTGNGWLKSTRQSWQYSSWIRTERKIMKKWESRQNKMYQRFRRRQQTFHTDQWVAWLNPHTDQYDQPRLWTLLHKTTAQTLQNRTRAERIYHFEWQNVCE